LECYLVQQEKQVSNNQQRSGKNHKYNADAYLKEVLDEEFFDF
jgi:hypothetical protein